MLSWFNSNIPSQHPHRKQHLRGRSGPGRLQGPGPELERHQCHRRRMVQVILLDQTSQPLQCLIFRAGHTPCDWEEVEPGLCNGRGRVEFNPSAVTTRAPATRRPPRRPSTTSTTTKRPRVTSSKPATSRPRPGSSGMTMTKKIGVRVTEAQK